MDKLNNILEKMTKSELFQFAKDCHEAYCNNLEFGSQNTEVVINLSNLAYYTQNPEEKNAENHIKIILNWFKDNQDKLTIKHIPWCNIKGKVYCSINNNKIVQWWKKNIDEEWIKKNFTDSHRLYEFCYENHSEYVVVDTAKKYCYDSYEIDNEGFFLKTFK